MGWLQREGGEKVPSDESNDPWPGVAGGRVGVGVALGDHVEPLAMSLAVVVRTGNPVREE